MPKIKPVVSKAEFEKLVLKLCDISSKRAGPRGHFPDSIDEEYIVARQAVLDAYNNLDNLCESSIETAAEFMYNHQDCVA